MFKNFVQKLNMFRADCGEYLRLCRRCRELGRDIFKKRDAITVVYELGQEVKEPYCIKSVLVSFAELADGNLENRKNDFVENLCPNYEKCHAASGCARYAQKREYENTVAEYTATVAARRAFWRNRSRSNSK